MKKLHSRSGETLVESLCALLVATLSILMLASSIAASARVNQAANRLRKSQTFLVTGAPQPAREYSLTLGGTELPNVQFFETKTDEGKGYFYYAYQKPNPSQG